MHFKSIKFFLIIFLILFSTKLSNAANFSDVTSTNLPAINDYSLGAVAIDVDKDNDLDIFVANNGQDRLLIDDKGVFSDATSTNLPPDTDNSRGAAVGDVDGDGDNDIFVANGGPNNRDGQNKLLINSGSGVFTDMSSTWLPQQDPRFYTSGAFGDIDEDGDLDLVVSSHSIAFPPGSPTSASSPIRIFTNDNKTKFVDESSTRLTGLTVSNFTVAQKVILADFDRDGDLDILVINGLSKSNKLLLNDSKGNFTEDTTGIIPSDSDIRSSAAVADIDGDGKIDYIFIANDAGQQNRLYVFNSSTSKFEDKTSANLSPDNDNSFAAAFGDLNGDNKLDIVVANGKGSGQANKVYLNDGDGKFTVADSTFFPADADFSTAVLVENFDETQGNEVFVANAFDQQNKLYTAGEIVPQTLSIDTISLKKARLKRSYNAKLEASGGTLPYTWKLKGKLPPGLKLNKTTGKISGKAKKIGTFKFKIIVTDSSDPKQSDSKNLKIKVTK